MLDVRSLSVSYGQHVALENAGIHVGRGEIVVILGANGAGKSSLLKAISGICEGKTTGSVQMQGNEILGLPANRIVEAGIALVPEGRGIFPDLSVQDNLTLGAHSERARDTEESNLARVFSLFPKLRERRRQIARTMSGGEQQMVAIGRAMMSNPAILTLDEPSLGLSPLLCKDLFQSLKTVCEAGIGILLVEQNAKQSLAIADRGYLIENGRIVHEAPAEVLMNDPAVQKAYLGGATAGGHTVPAPAVARQAPAQPAAKPTTAPAPSAPPRPAGQSPSDIAAAALQKFSRPAPAAPQPAPERPVQQATPPSPSRAPASPPPAPPRPVPSGGTRSASDILGVGIDDLVARASAKSHASVSPRNNGTAPPPAPNRANGATPPSAQRRTATTSRDIKMPDLSDTHDRLRSVLSEIEDAAARARAYRPNRDN